MSGKKGVALTAPTLKNDGDIVSEKAVEIAAQLENNQLIAGTTGVTITAPKGKKIVQSATGKIQSPKGKVTLKADDVAPLGEVSSKDIEIHV